MRLVQRYRVFINRSRSFHPSLRSPTTDQPKPRTTTEISKTNQKRYKSITYDYPTSSRYDIDAVRQFEDTIIYLIRHRPTLNQPPTKQECYGVYSEELHKMIMTYSPDCPPEEHRPILWKEWKYKFRNGSPVNCNVAIV